MRVAWRLTLVWSMCVTNSSPQGGAANRLILRAVVYYLVLVGGTALAWRAIPHNAALLPTSLEALMGGTEELTSKGLPIARLDEASLAISVGVAILAAVLLMLPVAWVYQLTRAKRGYQQSIVQLLVVLPAIVAGIVLLVKYSVALAFSLAGIVAAVRFRNTLDDSKDAVYVFLATGIGLASAVNLPVAAVMSTATTTATVMATAIGGSSGGSDVCLFSFSLLFSLSFSFSQFSLSFSFSIPFSRSFSLFIILIFVPKFTHFESPRPTRLVLDCFFRTSFFFPCGNAFLPDILNQFSGAGGRYNST